MQHCQASGLEECQRLTIDYYYTMKMELGEQSRKFLLRVDQMVKELERVDSPVDPKDIDIVILSGLTPQYDAEVRMLKSSSGWPTREWIKRALINQYERLECEESATGSRAMLSARGHRRNDKPPIRCPLCSRTGQSALNTANSRSPAERSQSDIRGRENMRQRRRRQNGGERGSNRGGGGSKNRSGGGDKQKGSSKDCESGDKTARPDCYLCLRCHKASEYPNLGAGLLVATSARPALAKL